MGYQNMSIPSQKLILSQAAKNRKGRIVGFGDQQDCTQHVAMIKRLRDIGFEEDRIFEILHSGPLGADPLAVKVDGMVIALRRAEAKLIEVEFDEAI